MASGSWRASSGASKLTRMINSGQCSPSNANLSLRKRRQASRRTLRSPGSLVLPHQLFQQPGEPDLPI